MSKEKLISSAELSSTDALQIGKEVGMLGIYDGLSTPFSEDIIVLNDEHRMAIERFARDSITNYGPPNANGSISPEPTRVQTEFGVPTLITRIDCTIDASGNIAAYEMEDSPSGVGVTTKIHQAVGAEGVANQLRSHYDSLIGQLPFIIVSGARNHGTDDASVFGTENYFYQSGNQEIPRKLTEDKVVIVKAIPGQPQSLDGYMELRDRSICTMKSEGDKAYGERVGIYQKIENVDDLHQTDDKLTSQAVKKALCSMAMGVKVYLTPEKRSQYGSSGTVSASKLGNVACGFIESDGYAYTQVFQPAVQAENAEGRNNLILRVYTLIDPAVNGFPISARVIGGCYVARREIVVHGASNSITGAIITRDARNEK
jgi:hypothetical protein